MNMRSQNWTRTLVLSALLFGSLVQADEKTEDAPALQGATVVEREPKTLQSEEFNGDELGTGWEVQRADLDRVGVVDGKLLVITQHVAPWTKNDHLKNLVVSNTSTSAHDLEIAVDLRTKITMQHHGAALLLMQDPQNYIELSFYGDPHGYNVKRMFRMRKCVNGHIAIHSRHLKTGPAEKPEAFRLKIVRRGPSFTGYYTNLADKTGTVWVEVGQQTAPSLTKLTPVLKAANGDSTHYGGGKVTEIDVEFDRFQLTEQPMQRTLPAVETGSDVIYSTNFADVDRFAKEFKIFNHIPTHTGLDNGLNLVAQYGRLRDTKDFLKNLVVMQQEMPEGDWDLEVQAELRLTSQHNDVGVMLYQDDKNVLELGKHGHPWGYNVTRRFYFDKAVQGKEDRIEEDTHRFAQAKQASRVLFKIEKRSRTYTASVYTKNETSGKWEWIAVGSHSMLRFQPRLAFYAKNVAKGHYGGEASHEVPIRFEKVTIRRR